jgi:phospholipase/carboxylesterase
VELIYRSILPEHAPYPLLVLMHGLGSNEEDLLSLQPFLPPEWGVASLRAPYAYGPGFAWFGVEAPHHPASQEFLSSIAAVGAWLEEIPARFPQADPSHLVLGGFSQGAVMALSVSFSGQVAVKPAGTCVLSGYLPEQIVLKPGPSQVFWGHGTQDNVLPVSLAVKAVAALQPYAAHIDFRQYPMAHEVGERELQDLTQWLAQQYPS